MVTRFVITGDDRTVREEMSDVGVVICQATLEGRIEEALQYPGC